MYCLPSLAASTTVVPSCAAFSRANWASSCRAHRISGARTVGTGLHQWDVAVCGHMQAAAAAARQGLQHWWAIGFPGVAAPAVGCAHLEALAATQQERCKAICYNHACHPPQRLHLSTQWASQWAW